MLNIVYYNEDNVQFQTENFVFYVWLQIKLNDEMLRERILSLLNSIKMIDHPRDLNMASAAVSVRNMIRSTTIVYCVG